MSGGGGGHSRGKKREHHEEHEEHVNHEAWVIPYADVLTLLMALFLVLFALGQTDEEKADIAAMTWRKSLSTESLFQFGISTEMGSGGSGPLASGALGVLEGVGPKPAPTEENNGGGLSENAGEARPAIVVISKDGTVTEIPAVTIPPVDGGDVTFSDPLTYVEDTVRDRAQGTGLLDKIGFRREPRGLVVTILTDQVVFGPGEAEIQPGGFQLLDVVADSLAPLSNDVMVEGHTDSRPISTTLYPSNWELSTARATSVLRYLVEARGFPADRISAAGYADTHPVDFGTSDAALARNRRVEIVVLATSSATDEAAAPVSSPATVPPTAPLSIAPAVEATAPAEEAG